ncbi:hypothetical protein HU200_024197 [Digitaria exilis]|uniref:RING-type E3 ubiquitin transferase n=1 Tax=Digitaria exilis TaxID=1010633 RepID=A0A835C453_9POAL|nr:hypothetical protein HU200_024197 [Digitaria exilis]
MSLSHSHQPTRETPGVQTLQLPDANRRCHLTLAGHHTRTAAGRVHNSTFVAISRGPQIIVTTETRSSRRPPMRGIILIASTRRSPPPAWPPRSSTPSRPPHAPASKQPLRRRRSPSPPRRGRSLPAADSSGTRGAEDDELIASYRQGSPRKRILSPSLDSTRRIGHAQTGLPCGGGGCARERRETRPSLLPDRMNGVVDVGWEWDTTRMGEGSGWRWFHVDHPACRAEAAAREDGLLSPLSFRRPLASWRFAGHHSLTRRPRPIRSSNGQSKFPARATWNLATPQLAQINKRNVDLLIGGVWLPGRTPDQPGRPPSAGDLRDLLPSQYSSRSLSSRRRRTGSSSVRCTPMDAIRSNQLPVATKSPTSRQTESPNFVALSDRPSTTIGGQRFPFPSILHDEKPGAIAFTGRKKSGGFRPISGHFNPSSPTTQRANRPAPTPATTRIYAASLLASAPPSAEMDNIATIDAWPSSPYSSSAPDGEVLRSLHRLARDLSATEAPAPFLPRRARLLAAVFEDLLLCGGAAALGPLLMLPRSASLCLREVLLVLQRFKALVADCAARSRMRLLLQSDEVAARAGELQHDLATLLDLLPVADLGLADDVADLLALASRQCRRRRAAAADAEVELKSGVLALIHEVEREIVPGRERLEGILEEVGINDPASCSDEIETLEREIGERVAERWTPSMIALVGLLRYAKCVLFSAATPRPVDYSKVDLDADGDGADEPPSPPLDFRCPISLELMRDPVVASSGQTYDRESITRWFGSGKSTCPKTGQKLANLELVPNKALKTLIARWCRENGVAVEVVDGGKSEPASSSVAVAANKAALEAARMTASFLVKKLSATFSPEATKRVVHEIRQLAKSGSDNRAFIGEAGAAALIVPLLRSEDSALQLNAVTALLNLSILEANKRRIMHAEGAVDALCHVMRAGASWRAKENAAATVLSLAAVHAYRRRLGRNARVVEAVVELARTGPPSTKKDALAALLSLSGERENIGRLVEAGAAEASVSAIGEEEAAAAVLASLAKRGGAEAIVAVDGAVARLVAEMRRGTEWSRECAAAALVLLCRRAGAKAAAQVMAVSGVEWAIWELLGTGTERARRKAASLGRACRRWAAAANAASAERSATECPTVSGAATAVTTASQAAQVSVAALPVAVVVLERRGVHGTERNLCLGWKCLAGEATGGRPSSRSPAFGQKGRRFALPPAASQHASS